MKRIKIVLILLLVMITAGCSVEYNLTINRDSSVNEKVVATENTRRMMINTNLDEKNAVNYLYEMFDRQELTTRMSYVSSEGNTIATVTGSHKTLQDFAANFNSDVFSNVTVSEDGDLVTLELDQVAKLGNDTSRSLVYDDITINIKVPFAVKEHNADEKRFDTYTWKIEKGSQLKNIKITYDKENYRDEQKITIGNVSFSVKYHYIAIFIIGIIIITIVVIVLIKNKKNNRL